MREHLGVWVGDVELVAQEHLIWPAAVLRGPGTD
jgi:hypothetical protein